MVTADQPDAPPYFSYDAEMNARERQTLSEALSRELRPMTLDASWPRRPAGAQLLDTRDPAEFAAAHLAGSINVGLGGQYATWAGTVLARDAPIVLVAEPGAEHESAMRLGRIGFDNVDGYLDGGLRSAEPRPDLIASTERLSPEACRGATRVRLAARVLDVRAAGERAQGADSRRRPRSAQPAQSNGSASCRGERPAAAALRRRVPVGDRRERPATPRIRT